MGETPMLRIPLALSRFPGLSRLTRFPLPHFIARLDKGLDAVDTLG
jgi:hypothetical protein